MTPRHPSAVGARVGVAFVAVAALAWAGAHASSGAVRAWKRGAGSTRRRRGLAARVIGGGRSSASGDMVVVLLSGLAASQKYWGAPYDRLARNATVVAMDPLGFGSSMAFDSALDVADPAVHVRMIDETLADLGLTGRPVVVVGHSMGASLALRWAASTDAALGVICFGAPLYRGDAEVTEQMRHLGWFEALLARGPLAERVCHWMCANRGTAQWLAVAIAPGLPVPVARDAVRHTWAGYIGAFRALIAHPGWGSALTELSRRRVPVHVVYGDSDGVPVDGRAAELAEEFEVVISRTLAGGHDLPLARAQECAAYVEAIVDACRSQLPERFASRPL